MENTNMTAVTKSITELEGNKFWIPAYQRGFRWTRQQIKELVEDLDEFIRDLQRNAYCLQPVVIKATTKEDIGNCYEVIDGQQRLTALYLIGNCYKVLMGKGEPTCSDYQLCFEGKADFEELLSRIKNLEECSKIQFSSELGEFKKIYKDIDSQNVIQILLYLLENWGNDSDLKLQSKLNRIYADISDKRKSVFVIWNEMDVSAKDENCVIEAFANVNANKIPLTDAELIKAMLLDAYGKFINDDNIYNNEEKAYAQFAREKLILEREAKFANQWEIIERGLNNEDFWAFFMPNTDVFKTRIEALFDIWYETNNIQIKAGEHLLYRAVKKYLDDKNNSPVTLWKKIVEIFENLQDWYNNYKYYHLVGCCSLVSKDKKRTTFAKDLFIKYCEQNNKKDFETYLRKKLFEDLCSALHPKSNQKLSKEEFYPTIENIDYDASDKVRVVLATFNIALLVNAYDSSEKNCCERFPFGYYKDLIKKSKIDIEHINPQNAEDTSKDNEKTIKLNSLNNLTLLDKTLNIKVSNYNFLQKRHYILEALRGKGILANSVVFPGTRWVFLREWVANEYSIDTYNNINNEIWSDAEGENYVNFIKESLLKLLPHSDIRNEGAND